MPRKLLASAAFTMCMLAAAAAKAQGPTPQLYVGCSTNAANWTHWNSGAPGTMNLNQSPSYPNVWLYDGSYAGALWSANWEGWVDIDPAINHAIVITNNSGVTQNFVSVFTLPTAFGIPAPSVVEGGVAITISAPGFPGTIAAAAGDHIYEAQVGGVSIGPIGELLASPFALSTGVLGQTNATGPHNFGPAPGPGLAPIDSMGIRYSFTLTAGATATLNGHFILVPGPASAALLGLGTLLALRRRRLH